MEPVRFFVRVHQSALGADEDVDSGPCVGLESHHHMTCVSAGRLLYGEKAGENSEGGLEMLIDVCTWGRQVD